MSHPLLISEKHKLCFIHMPKTAGQWTKRFLLKLDVGFKRVKNTKNFIDIPLASNFNNDYYKFGFVRDPVDWYQSFFNFQSDDFHNRFLFDRMMVARDINEYITNIKNVRLTKARMTLMYNYIFSVGHENECKNIFKYENLYDSLLKILNDKGIDASSLMEKEKTQKRNASKKKCGEKINQESLDFIYESCKGIYEKFNYKRRYV
tara:strand:+ start:366 stop:980 length:615 start_codon:yes stop_codon:yes gene_type:complete